MIAAITAIAAVVVSLAIFCFHKRKWPKKPDFVTNEPYSTKTMIAALPKPLNGRVMVTGGLGNVGATIIDLLLAQGEKDIIAFDMVDSKRFAGDSRVRVVIGDITTNESVLAACEGVKVVYHTAALVAFHQRLKIQYPAAFRVNVTGTENVINACLAANVPTLIYTSTSNVNVSPATQRFDMDERAPYVGAQDCQNIYGVTKALAEKAVLAANGKLTKSGLRLQTVALRPTSGVFGPFDNVMVQMSVRSGKYIALFPDQRVQYVYVENVAYAHLLAEAKLRAGVKGIDGQAFCISNGPEGLIHHGDFAHMIRYFLPELKIDSAPVRLITCIAYIVEGLIWITGGRFKPKGELAFLTPAMIATSAMQYSFTDEKARTVLGYEPVYTLLQGMEHSVKVSVAAHARA